MTTNDNHLTEPEKQLLRLYRELDERGKRHVYLAAQSIKTTAEHQRERFALSID